MEPSHPPPPTMELAEATSLFASLAAELSLDDNAAFDELDVDGDGLVTNDEYVARLSTRRDVVLTKLTQSNLDEDVQQPIATMIRNHFDTEAACVANVFAMSGERAVDKDAFEFVHPLLESLCKKSMAANTIPSAGVEGDASATDGQAPPQGEVDGDANAQTDGNESAEMDVEPSASEGGVDGTGAGGDGSNRDAPSGSHAASPQDESPVSDEMFEPTTSGGDTRSSNSIPSNDADEGTNGGLVSTSDDTYFEEGGTPTENTPTRDAAEEATRDEDHSPLDDSSRSNETPTVTEGDDTPTSENPEDDAAVPSDSIAVADGTDVNSIDNESTGSDDANGDDTTPPTADADANVMEDTEDNLAMDEPTSSNDESNSTEAPTVSSTDDFNSNDANVEPATPEGDDGGSDGEFTTSPFTNKDETSDSPASVDGSDPSLDTARETPLPTGQLVADSGAPLSVSQAASLTGDTSPNATDALPLEPEPEPKSLARLQFENELDELFQNELARREQRLAYARLQVEKSAFVVDLLQECIAYAGRQFEFDALFTREKAIDWIKSDCLPFPGHFRQTKTTPTIDRST